MRSKQRWCLPGNIVALAAALCSLLVVSRALCAAAEGDISDGGATTAPVDDTPKEPAAATTARDAAAGPPKVRVYMYNFDAGDGNGSAGGAGSPPAPPPCKYFEAEHQVLDALAAGDIPRALRPEDATLFYLPFFSPQYTAPLLRGRKERRAVEETARLFCLALHRVRTELPFFNRSGGRDHFSVLSLPDGRCSVLSFCDKDLYGDIIFLQTDGESLFGRLHGALTSNMEVKSLDSLRYDTAGIAAVPCYVRGTDVVIPPALPDAKFGLLGGARPIKVLFAFTAGHAEQPGTALQFEHEVRRKLLEMYEPRNIDGWRFGVEGEGLQDTDALFCVVPPGSGGRVARVLARAIFAGCIPILFFRTNDRPWQDVLDYGGFSITIEHLDGLSTLQQRVDILLSAPGDVEKMQRNLADAQEAFMWARQLKAGARAHVLRALEAKVDATAARQVAGTDRRQFFKDVVVIVNFNHHENAKPEIAQLWREIYEPLFAAVVLVSGKEVPAVGVEKWPIPGNGPPGFYAYSALPGIMARFPAAAGFLWTNDDLILNYWLLPGCDKSKIWFLPPDEHSFTDVRIDSNENTTRGWEHFPEHRRAARCALAAVPPAYLDVYTLTLSHHMSKQAFADVFYVPARHAAAFAELVPIFTNCEVRSEMAVPMIFTCLDTPVDYDRRALRRTVYLWWEDRKTPEAHYSLTNISGLHPWKLGWVGQRERVRELLRKGDKLL